MKKKKWIIWISVLLVAAVAIWFWKFRKAEDVIILETEKVQSGTVSISVTATGTLQPVDTVAVGSQISGTIQRVYVDFNSEVHKGQLLAQLDKSLMEAQVMQYTALLQQARANQFYQQSNQARQQKLFAVGALSKADLETAVFQLSSARESVNSVSAQLKTARKNLGFADIYSPIDGMVLSRSVSEGQTVAASLSTPTLFSIAKDLTHMQVQASVDEADIGNVKKGQRVIFSVDAFPADTFHGTVKEIRLRSSVSANVVTYLTIIEAPNDNMQLKPGMTASITIYTNEVSNVLVVPAAALQFKPDSLLIVRFHLSPGENKTRKRGGGKREVQAPEGKDSLGNKITSGTVWIRVDSLTIVPRPVTIGLDDKTLVQIISGLKADEVVVTGYKKIKKGAASTATKSPFQPTRGGGGNRGQPH